MLILSFSWDIIQLRKKEEKSLTSCGGSVVMFTSQLVLFLWKTVEIDPLGHVRLVETLQNFVQKCDPVILSGIHIHIAGVQQFHCRWDTFCIKDLSFPILCKWPYRPRFPVSRPTTMDSCVLVHMFSLVTAAVEERCRVFLNAQRNHLKQHLIWILMFTFNK